MPWTDDKDNFLKDVPLYNIELQKEVISSLFPELAEFGFTDSRVCKLIQADAASRTDVLCANSYVGIPTVLTIAS